MANIHPNHTNKHWKKTRKTQKGSFYFENQLNWSLTRITEQIVFDLQGTTVVVCMKSKLAMWSREKSMQGWWPEGSWISSAKKVFALPLLFNFFFPLNLICTQRRAMAGCSLAGWLRWGRVKGFGRGGKKKKKKKASWPGASHIQGLKHLSALESARPPRFM